MEEEKHSVLGVTGEAYLDLKTEVGGTHIPNLKRLPFAFFDGSDSFNVYFYTNIKSLFT